MKEPNCCCRCGQSLDLIPGVPEEHGPVYIKDRVELCPECYRNLFPEELRHYFD